MADQAFNITKGRTTELAWRVKNNDPATSGFERSPPSLSLRPPCRSRPAAHTPTASPATSRR